MHIVSWCSSWKTRAAHDPAKWVQIPHHRVLEWVITDNEVWKSSCAFLRQCEQALVIHQHHAKKQLALLHIVYTAGSWPTVHHTATLIALSLGLLFPSLGAKVTTPIIIYTSCCFGSSLWMRKSNTLIIHSVVVFFSSLLVETLEEIWLYCKESLPLVSLEHLFHKVYLNQSRIQ